MKRVVMSVGGSLINPGEIDVSFLKKLKSFISNSKNQFVIVCGGGSPARVYPKAARLLGVDEVGCDEIGIRATLLNAELVRQVLNASAVEQVPKNIDSKLVVAGGWLPGCSTDLDAVLWAKKMKINTVVNLSNIDYVFDKDPSKNRSARPLKCLSWQEYRKLISVKWSAGLSTPFDPVASREAQKSKIKVFIINGERLGEINKALSGKPFVGTVIG